jgi:chorismate mutase
MTATSTDVPPADVSTIGIESVAAGRARLDDIDAQLRDLVRARRDISRHVQQLRREAGGPRIEHSRENQIVNTYADELGRPGVGLAMAVLEICRGLPG